MTFENCWNNQQEKPINCTFNKSEVLDESQVYRKYAKDLFERCWDESKRDIKIIHKNEPFYITDCRDASELLLQIEKYEDDGTLLISFI